MPSDGRQQTDNSGIVLSHLLYKICTVRKPVKMMNPILIYNLQGVAKYHQIPRHMLIIKPYTEIVTYLSSDFLA